MGRFAHFVTYTCQNCLWRDKGFGQFPIFLASRSAHEWKVNWWLVIAFLFSHLRPFFVIIFTHLFILFELRERKPRTWSRKSQTHLPLHCLFVFDVSFAIWYFSLKFAHIVNKGATQAMNCVERDSKTTADWS